MKKLTGALLAVLLVLLTSCNLPIASNPVDPTLEALQNTIAVQMAAQTLVAQTQSAQPLLPSSTTTNTPEVAAAVDTPTPTVTADLTARVSIEKNVNCRVGPFTVFPVVVSLKTGDTAEVLGKNEVNGLWYKLLTGDKRECWVTAEAVSLTNPGVSIALVDAPPTPTPVEPPKWNLPWTILFSNSPTDPETNASVLNVTFSQSGNSISGNFVSGVGSAIAFSGTVSADGMTVTGTLFYGPVECGLLLKRLADNPNQFRGKFWNKLSPGIDGAFCGGTGGASYPSPCRP